MRENWMKMKQIIGGLKSGRNTQKYWISRNSQPTASNILWKKPRLVERVRWTEGVMKTGKSETIKYLVFLTILVPIIRAFIR